MNVTTSQVGEVTVVALEGDIDGSTAPQAQAAILDQAKPQGKLILDMSQVAYMSSAGLRMLLVTYRTISAQQGEVVLVGLAEDLKDTMAMTGFLDFFTYHETLDAGLAELA